MVGETKIYPRKAIEAILEKQRRSLPEEIQRIVDLKVAMEEVDQLEVPVRHIPALLVIPIWQASLATQAAWLSQGGLPTRVSTGREDFFTKLDAAKLENAKPPYWVELGVEDGTETKGLSHEQAEAWLKASDRKHVFAESGLAILRTHAEVLRSHNLYLSGTAFGPNRTAHIMNTPKGLQLGQIDRNGGNPSMGTPSCMNRLIPV